MNSLNPRKILLVLVLAQFACTSLWFVGNAVLSDIIHQFRLSENVLGHLTSAVQLGFITGTLIFALINVADRYSPSKVFFVCALAGAFSNLLMIWADGLYALILLRCLTGFFLAGIYPVGMKIASDYHQKGLGKALGYLVGALVLGTAFPHFLKGITTLLNWEYVVIAASMLAGAGGILLVLFVPEGPYRSRSAGIDLTAIFRIFKKKDFRAAAFGYFGHMWELYTFWAFVPVILLTYQDQHANVQVNVPLTSFLIIAAGFPGCVAGGYLANRMGSAATARFALSLSFICCIISPLSFLFPFPLFIAFLVFWSVAVVADSPQFSALVANFAFADTRGTALTIVNCIGFSITIISIMAISLLRPVIAPEYLYLFLAFGPLFGLIAFARI